MNESRKMLFFRKVRNNDKVYCRICGELIKSAKYCYEYLDKPNYCEYIHSRCKKKII